MERDDTSGVSVERQISLASSPDEIWHFVAEGEALSDWMGGEVHIDPKPGGEITLETAGADPVWGTVEEVVPCRRLQWSWRTDDGLPTMVEIELEETASNATTLIVRETLLPWHISGPGIGLGVPEARATRFDVLAAA